MDWNNLVSWQHNSGYNTSSAFPVPPSNYQSKPSSTQQFHHAPVNYMMPFPPEPTPAKFVTPVMPPPVTSSQATPSPGYPAALPVRPQKAWLTPPDDWKPGDGMFDINQLYNFSLPMTVASTPHNTLRDMSGMDITSFVFPNVTISERGCRVGYTASGQPLTILDARQLPAHGQCGGPRWQVV